MLIVLIVCLIFALICLGILYLGWRTANIRARRQFRRPSSVTLFHSRVHTRPLDFGEWQPSAGDHDRNFSNRR